MSHVLFVATELCMYVCPLFFFARHAPFTALALDFLVSEGLLKAALVVPVALSPWRRVPNRPRR